MEIYTVHSLPSACHIFVPSTQRKRNADVETGTSLLLLLKLLLLVVEGRKQSPGGVDQKRGTEADGLAGELTDRQAGRSAGWQESPRWSSVSGDEGISDVIYESVQNWSTSVADGGMKFWGRQKIMSPTSTRNNTRNVSVEHMYQWSWRDNLAKTASQVERRVDWQQVRRETRCCSTVMWMWRKDGREWQENSMEPVRVSDLVAEIQCYRHAKQSHSCNISQI